MSTTRVPREETSSLAWVEEFGGGLPGVTMCSCDECFETRRMDPHLTATSLVEETFAVGR